MVNRDQVGLFFVINTSFRIFTHFSESEINYICELIVRFLMPLKQF
jgi:NADPH-dependent 7-cyano-7-deazaguanine reductase QueF